jgi:hypothetical protein
MLTLARDSKASGQDYHCADKVLEIINDPTQSETFNTLFVASGKSLNDLGNYEMCTNYRKGKILKYALVTVYSSKVESLMIQMGLCIPVNCTAIELSMFDKMFMQGIKYTKFIEDPQEPKYSFPKEEELRLRQEGVGFWFMTTLLVSLIGISIFGYFIEKGTLGDLKHRSALVEAIEEGRPDKTSIEARKTRWALVVYSFSLTRNFSEIFVRPNSKSIKDKKFEVFNGLRFLFSIWIMMGNVYVIGAMFGNTGPIFRQ